MKNALEMIKESWQPFKKKLGLTLGVPAILVFVPTIIVGVPALIAMVLLLGVQFFNVITSGNQLSHPYVEGRYTATMIPLGIVTCIAFAAVYNAFRVGWTRILLKLARNEPCSMADMTAALSWFLKFLITMVITGVATFIGALCFVVPGIYIGVRTALAPFIVVDEDLGPIEALMRSHQLVTGYAWQILLYLLMLLAANWLASFVPLGSIILYIPIMGLFDLALARIYVMLKDGTSNQDLDDD